MESVRCPNPYLMIGKSMRAIYILLPVLVAGCAHNDTVVMNDRKIEEPKVIALDAPRAPWVVEIERRLRKEGFTVLRWASQQKVKEQVSSTRSEEFDQSSTRYVLAIDGQASMDPMHRCFGGGYSFDYLTAELVDTQANETLVSVSGSGFSEGCQPMSVRLFTNISTAVVNAWR